MAAARCEEEEGMGRKWRFLVAHFEHDASEQLDEFASILLPFGPFYFFMFLTVFAW